MSRLAAKSDGRSARSQRTRAALVASCRKLMVALGPQPSLEAIAADAGVSKRSAYNYFRNAAALYREALWDPAVGVAILARVLGGELPKLGLVARDRVLRALVLDEDQETGEPLPVLLLLPEGKERGEVIGEAVEAPVTRAAA